MSIDIVSIGMMTSVGHDSIQSCSSIRADINRFAEIHLINSCGEQMKVSPVFLLAKNEKATARMKKLALPAMKEAMEKLSPKAMNNVALLLALPSRQRELECSYNIYDTLVQEIKNNPSKPFADSQRICSQDHSGGLSLLLTANHLFNQGVKYCLLGGVDSYCHYEILEELDNNRQLKSEVNVNGFIPGEAAAFLVLQNHNPQNNFVRISGYTENKDLSQAIRYAISMSGNPPESIAFVYCDMNGQKKRSLEFQIAMQKVLPFRDREIDIIHPSDCIGDVGAASGPVFLALAATALRRSYSYGNKGLICCSSHDVKTCAVIEYCA